MLQTVLHDRRPQGRVYSDEEWEKVKLLFHHHYIEKNKSLKAAARLVFEAHGFDATLRQWERRIAPEKWNFTKYARSDERLQQIKESGKSLLEVSRRGRRKSVASDGRPVLNEDRNLRRFARREVSRSCRPRAKSVGTTAETLDQQIEDTRITPSPSESESSMYFEDPVSGVPNLITDVAHAWIPAQNFSQDFTVPRIEICDVETSHNQFLPQIVFSGPEDLAPVDFDTSLISPLDNLDDVLVTPDFDSDLLPTLSARPGDVYNLPSFSLSNQSQTLNNGIASHRTTGFKQGHISHEQSLPKSNMSHSSFSTMADGLGGHKSTGKTHEYGPTVLAHANMFSEMSIDDELPDLDNTYADVHNLLNDHQDRLLQMVRGCMQGCVIVAGQDESMRNSMLAHLTLLEKGIQAQSETVQIHNEFN